MGLAAFLAYLALFVRVSRSPDFELVGGVAVVPGLVVGWVLLVRYLADREADPVIARILRLSVVAKLVAVATRYVVEVFVYGGLADAGLYDRGGQAVASAIWSGDLGTISFDIGTRMMEVITGVVYAVVGPSPLTAFVAFGLLAWIGQLLFVRAHQAWMGDERRRNYTALVMFLPAVVFWSASIGKEAWMLLTLGMASLGIARFFRDRSGLVLAMVGLAGAALIRPHMSIMIVVAAGGALILSGRGSIRTSTRLVGVTLLAAGGLVLASQMQAFVGLDSLTVESLAGLGETIDRNTAVGGSEFSNVSITNPLLFPIGFVSTVLRPFPWEAGNVPALMVSLEGVFLVVFAWMRRRSFRRIPRLVRANPYAAFCLVFTVVFVVGFSNFNNLGLLARERAMLFPMLLVFLALRAPSEFGVARQSLEPDRSGVVRA